MKNSLVELFEVSTTNQPNPPDLDLYCDMDGVLTDFDGRFEYFTGMTPDEFEKKYNTQEFWSLIDEEIGEVFWSGMTWTPRGKELWNILKPYSPTLLTSPSRNKVSRVGKEKWAKSNLSPSPKVVFAYSAEKHQYASPRAVHIDDKKSTIKNWITAGGIGIYHPKNTDFLDPIIDKLREIGYLI